MPNWAIISRSGSVSAAAAVDTPNCMALVLAAALHFELPSFYRHIFRPSITSRSRSHRKVLLFFHTEAKQTQV